MTSRNPQCGLLANACDHEELVSLEEPECVQLLKKTAKLSEVAHDTEDNALAIKLVEHLGHHTLAILHAGSYIATKRYRVADYLDFIRTNRRRLLETSRGQGTSRYDTVYATFGASMEFLEQPEEGPSEETRKDALELLKVLSTFHYMSVPLDVLEDASQGVKKALKTPKKFEMYSQYLTPWHVAQVPDLVRTEDNEVRFRITEAVTRLESLALVRTDQSTRAWKSVSMHPLVHGWLRDRQNQQERNSVVRTTVYIVALSYYTLYGWRSYHHQFRPHFKLLVESDADLVDDAAQSRPILQTCVWIAWMHQTIGLDRDMYEFTGRIFQLLGLHDQEPTEDLRELHRVFGVAADRDRSYPAQALRAFEAIARLDEKKLGENHPDRLYNMHELGSAYRKNARAKEAVALLRRVVKTRQELWEENEELLTVRHTLGMALLDDDQIKEAIPLLEKVVEASQSVSSESPERLVRQQALAAAYLADGQIAEATRLLEEVARIQARTLGEEHRDTILSQQWLAKAYMQAGKSSKAVPLLERVVNTRTSILGENNPDALGSQHNLARAYLDTGRIQEATNILEHVVNIQNSTLDETDNRKLSSQHLLAQAYLKSDKGSKAIGLLEQVVDVRESMFKSTDRRLLVPRHAFARAYLKVGRTSEAINILESVVDLEQSRCDEKDADSLIPQQLLARAYLSAGRNSEAVGVLEQVMGMEAMLYDEGHRFRIESQELLDKARAGCDRSSSNSTETSLSPAERAQSDSVVRDSRESASGTTNHRPDFELEENECEGSNETQKIIPLINSRAAEQWTGRLRKRRFLGRVEAPAVTHPARKRKKNRMTR